MQKKLFLALIKPLVQAVEDNFLSPEDFMEKLNHLYSLDKNKTKK